MSPDQDAAGTAGTAGTAAALSLRVRVVRRDVDLALEVRPGETVALLGPNGAGKSTALAAVAGLLRPDSGSVVIDGRELNGDGRSGWVAPHERQVALLAQDPLLFPHLSVLDNVAFGPRSAGVPRRLAAERARHWLGEVDAADLADRRPHQLSGGQAQRVAVARALAAEPRVLLLDEPMAALDVAVAPALRQTLRRVLAERTTVLVTHDVLDAITLADRVLVVEGGRVVEEGACTAVLARPRSPFAARIAGLNLLPGTWTGTGVEVDAAAGVEVQGLGGGGEPGAAVVAVFRPGAVSVYDDEAGGAAPTGSPRNAFAVTLTELEPLGDRIRVRGTAAAGPLAADVTPQAVADLALAPGRRVRFTVKATEVDVYPR